MRLFFLYSGVVVGGDEHPNESSRISRPSEEEGEPKQQPQRGSSGVLQSMVSTAKEITSRSFSNVSQVVRSGSTNSAEGGIGVFDKAREGLSNVSRPCCCNNNNKNNSSSSSNSSSSNKSSRDADSSCIGNRKIFTIRLVLSSSLQLTAVATGWLQPAEVPPPECSESYATNNNDT